MTLADHETKLSNQKVKEGMSVKVSKMEVFKRIMEIAVDFHSEGVATVGSVAKYLNTTPYYVRKRIKTLIEEGYLVKGIRKGGFDELSCMPYPPLKGYCLTEKAKSTELYLITLKEEEEALIKAFGY